MKLYDVYVKGILIPDVLASSPDDAIEIAHDEVQVLARHNDLDATAVEIDPNG